VSDHVRKVLRTLKGPKRDTSNDKSGKSVGEVGVRSIME